MDLKRKIAADLEEARQRTHHLLAPVDDERLVTQHDPVLSPPIWDYGHVGVFEELWLVQKLSGAGPMEDWLMHAYNPFDNPRAVRGRMKLMDRPATMAYLDKVRGRVLELLEEVDLSDSDPLLRDGYVYDLIVQHEHQHDETILQTLQLMPGGYLRALPPGRAARVAEGGMVEVPGGGYPVGTDAAEPYDNEHPRHEVELRGFRIDRFPVSNGDYQRFMDDGGYSRDELWSKDGWDWVETFRPEAPEYWFRSGEGWLTSRFGQTVPVDPTLPVMHVCYFEAEAYARWAGKRLPDEFEWEVAASWDPQTGRARRYPWGDDPPTAERVNLDQLMFGPAAVGAYPAGASALGCEQMLGDVWEWTSSHFLPYPGFVAFPYPEYSEPFFGDTFRVLRGASWATRPRVARVTFRNWDSPIKRQIFAGFRCAMEVTD
jgi:gamma-glutamyl hercynylcysteine S-oxide synthase